jgi:hypothetical protein
LEAPLLEHVQHAAVAAQDFGDQLVDTRLASDGGKLTHRLEAELPAHDAESHLSLPALNDV